MIDTTQRHSAPPRRDVLRIARHAALLGVLVATGGCFSQRSFPVQPGDVRLISIADVHHADDDPTGDAPTAGRSARAWLRAAHADLADLLPEPGRPALLTEDLTDDAGRPIDVYRRLRENPKVVHTIFGNFRGVLHSAQATGADLYIEERAPTWPGCEWVWIPIEDDLELSAQFGLARRDGKPVDADCIIILPGFFGDSGPQRSQDLGQLFLSQGFHVLGLEQRGTGQTERRYPHIPSCYGVLETADLLAVDEWLRAQPHVRRTGMIGFCWGANLVLLAAWEDGRPEPDTDSGISPRLRAIQRPATAQRHFEAGVIGFSPTLRFEDYADRCQRPHSIWDNAILDRFQAEVEERQVRHHYPVTGSLRELIDSELERSPRFYPGMVADGLDFLRFLPYKDLLVSDKLEHARIPTLIVHAVNDPMGNAQDIPDLIATLDNPHIAALVLPGGGHLGFAPYAREYFFSLLINFFDPQRGPAAEPQ